jgi:hypothetical protein
MLIVVRRTPISIMTVDFHAYPLVDLYQDKNAFHPPSAWKQVPIPTQRTADRKVLSMMDDVIRLELVAGHSWAVGRAGRYLAGGIQSGR